ncbi:hypothetical protein EOS93_18765 [Rhizobium sp. RMa-01]|uniref:DUF5691 domain-containing protein n=1 Tax=unclassified Rhizobium TaxID=2613769 RepID=UPI0008DAFB94|nr:MULTISPECIES: DUF5691 domain-containing protein [unclassified Rhizobium]OHV19084.1 hypothetical protein BBJ66_17170 [Rhizobium sp. RSm-3]RVU09494.1 hypothetical protein EOS93_18765 [Rhizobium sp. RMa-01]
MNVPDLKNVILPKLLSGVRDGLPLDAIGATDCLQALALTGQALRFDRPRHPERFQVEESAVDHGAILPDVARKLVLRLLSGKNPASAPLAAAIVRKLAERKLRLHPFDLPKLEPFVKAHAENLGAEALAFSQRETPAAQKQNYFAPERLSDDNWMLATPAVKAGYIKGRRASDPDAARAMVEAVWTSENADSRLRLLEAFREALSENDAHFLKGLEKDRAPRVRELAQRLLVRLPGFNGDDPSLRAALERIKVSKAGLIFKRTALTLELPATVRDFTKMAWLNETFGPVGLDTLAGALSLPVDDMVAAAEKQSDLLAAFLFMATRDKRLDVVRTITERHLRDVWEAFSQFDAQMLADYSPDMRQLWVEHIFRPDRWAADTSAWAIRQTAQWLDGEATENLFSAILQSKPWHSLRRDNGRYEADILDSMAVMSPSSMRSTLRAELAALEPAKSGNAFLFLDLMDSLETAHA